MRIPHLPQHPLLALVQGIQPHEDVLLCFRKMLREQIGHWFGIQAVGYLAVDAPFSSHAGGGHLLSEGIIKRKKDVPDTAETFLVFSTLLELPQEVLHGLPLGRLEKIEISLKMPVIGNVLEKLPGGNPVFVDFGKVVEDDPAPEHEFVQGFGGRIQLLVTVVEREQRGQPVGGPHFAQSREEVVDGNGFRGYHHACIACAFLCQILAEEADRPLVREDKTHPADFRSRMIMICNLFQKWCHRRSVIVQSLS